MQEPPSPTILMQPDAGAARLPPGGAAPAKPKLKKLRLAFVLLGLGLLALVSTIFGMMMAVASDLPELENQREFRSARNSELTASDGKTPVAKLTGNNNRILLGERDISPNIANAVIAVEDRRFYAHQGVDYKGIGRAVWQDLRQQRAAQGGSTITQQFVKNALVAQGNRSVFQKLRESALAYHLERQWSKQKIITQYLNTVYFGNGAYGVEAAVRTYFGKRKGMNAATATQPAAATTAQPQQPDVKRLLARDVTPAQAAMLAAMIASPSRYDPADNPSKARQRRDQVLKDMLEQGTITSGDYREGIAEDPPRAADITPSLTDSTQPYFSSWLTQQLVDRYGSGAIFGGGLKIKTTIDPELQQSAEQAISRRLTGVGPDASLVAIENKTGEVRAMVGGTDFQKKPFNLATNGHRQPGSAFKPFTLIAALERGVSPDATFASQKKVFPVPNSRTEKFVVNNYEDNYSGVASLRSATASSDNSVYAELGLQTGTRRIARLAQRMGLRTPVSDNPAMTLGGLKQGLTPLELAYAYTTIANGGRRVSGSLAASKNGPVGIAEVKGGGRDDRNQTRSQRVFSKPVADTTQQLLNGVITSGTGEAAQIDEFAAGKTGTTENYGDAWFVGFNKELTVAVWVGHADELTNMKTEYRGGPVAGGTYPAEIWHDFMTSWIGIRERRDAAKGKDDEPESTVPAVPSAPAPSEGQGTAPQSGQTTPQAPEQPQARPKATPRQRPSPQPAPAPTPAPQPSPPTRGGGGTGEGGATPGGAD